MKYNLSENVMCYETEDEKYLLNLDNNDTFLLNDISAYIINLVEANNDIFEIIKNLYEIVKEQITYDSLENDVLEFIVKLESENFIIRNRREIILNDISEMLKDMLQREIVVHEHSCLKLGSTDFSLNISSLEMIKWFIEIESKYGVEITADDKKVEHIVNKILTIEEKNCEYK